MWTVLDPNTHVMTVVGGSLYRYSDERGHALQFVPYAQTSYSSGYPQWQPSPSIAPCSTSLPVGGH